MARARVGTVLGTMEVIQTCKHDEDGDDVDAGDSGLYCFPSTVENLDYNRVIPRELSCIDENKIFN